LGQVAYYYDPEVGSYYYGNNHPMKPHRVRMAHDLIVRYGLYKDLQVCAGDMQTGDATLSLVGSQHGLTQRMDASV
jgi:histone deacetylase 1/2